MGDGLSLYVLEYDVAGVALYCVLDRFIEAETLKGRGGFFEAAGDAPFLVYRRQAGERVVGRIAALYYRVERARRVDRRVCVVGWRGPKQRLDREAHGHSLALIGRGGRRQRVS